MEPDEFVWRNPKGEDTPVVQMDDRHLRNSIALIKRRLDAVARGVLVFEDISTRFWVRWADMLPLLLAEQRRREDKGIKVDPKNRQP